MKFQQAIAFSKQKYCFLTAKKYNFNSAYSTQILGKYAYTKICKPFAIDDVAGSSLKK